jgi:hypothetical protein
MNMMLKGYYLLMPQMPLMRSMNRNFKVALRNIKWVCPALENVLTNCYQSPIHLFKLCLGEGSFCPSKELPKGTCLAWPCVPTSRPSMVCR